MNRDDDATPEQYAELRRLFAERQASLPGLAALRSELENGEVVGKREASLAIDLMRKVKDIYVAQEGVYYFEQAYYRVLTSKAGNRYARRLLRLDTLKKDGRSNWEYMPSMAYRLPPDSRLFTPDIDRISHKYRVCLLCGSYRGGNEIFGRTCYSEAIKLSEIDLMYMQD